MSTVTLAKWGNSVGIRIPAAIIKEAHLTIGEELRIVASENGVITLIPVTDSQSGWTEAFNAIADAKADTLSIDLPNEFDEDEWTW